MKPLGRAASFFVLLFVLFLSAAAPSCQQKGQTDETSKAAAAARTATPPPATPTARIHHSAIAGSWYPADPEKLAALLDGFLEKADSEERVQGLRALISPHAGYAYSGQAAAFSYRQAAGRNYKRVVILAPSHYASYHGGSIPDVDYYETPLGLVPLDKEACAKLLENPLFGRHPEAHLREHSVEMQIPFLQRVLGDFKLVPIVFSYMEGEDFAQAAEALRPLQGDETLFVASSDFTHYGERFGYWPFRAASKEELKEKLEKLDMGAVDFILDFDGPGFLAYKEKTGDTICGYAPITVLLDLLAPKKDELAATLLKYYTSLDATGDASSTVSYVSIVFSKPGNEPMPTYAPSPIPEPGDPPAGATGATGADAAGPRATPTPLHTISEAERRTLLKLARDTVNLYVREGKKPDLKNYDITPRLEEVQGAFVTLNDPNGDLRGCIGHIVGREPLAETVEDNAVNAAVHDPRFSPVRPDEIDGLSIEISAMSPLKKVDSADDIILGVDGVVLKKGFSQSVYLPQVATETGWTKKHFLERLSMKAGLPPDAWKTAELYVFRAEVFGEKEEHKP